MKVLCLDPSLRAYGWAIISKDDIIDGGCILTSADNSDSISLEAISKELKRIIQKHKPTTIIFEIAAGSKSARANQALAYVRGLTISACIFSDIPYEIIRAKQIKTLLTGDAHASKEQILDEIRKNFSSFDKIVYKMPKIKVYAVSDAAATYFGLRKHE